MQLNNLETAILKAIIDENSNKYPFLSEHFKYLFVLSREFTGVGMYTNFGYNLKFNNNQINKNINIDIPISSAKSLFIEGFQYEISYKVNITNGKINLLEIVTNEDTLFDNTINLDKFKLI
ncbi:MAG: hypothetical protein LBJ88_00475 [Campylobacteraceae bacterium]|jgi:hypothetical protein|nr:hypothetical protein [Campylobacteraceae bacterium]